MQGFVSFGCNAVMQLDQLARVAAASLRVDIEVGSSCSAVESGNGFGCSGQRESSQGLFFEYVREVLAL